jgi:hypothetical protein
MNELSNEQKETDKPDLIGPKNALDVHEFLMKFFDKFHIAKRGGIYDYMELFIFQMINLAISNINKYFLEEHKEVNINEIMFIVVDSFQTVLDKLNRNLEKVRKVNLR